MVTYPREPETPTNSSKAMEHPETAHVGGKLPLLKAKRYLDDVIAYKQAISSSRYCRGVLKIITQMDWSGGL